MSHTRQHNDDLDPALAEILDATFAQNVGVETAARHLWSIHRAGQPVVSAARHRFRRAAVSVMSALMLVTSSGGALAASTSSLPGDVLYPVKRGAERARLLLTVSPEADAKIHLLMARTRMDEAQRAIERARPAIVPRLVDDAIAALELAERVGGADLRVAAEEVRRETTEHAVQIAAVLEAPNREQVEHSVSRLTVEAEVAAVEIQPAPQPTDSTEARAETGSVDTATATAPGEEGTATPTSEPSATGSPTVTTSPEPTGSATPSPTPTESPSPTPSPTPTPSSSTTSEPTPGEAGGSKRYESEGSSAAEPTGEASPSPTATQEPTVDEVEADGGATEESTS